MSFTIELPVRFGHVDAAGIVFYPRYFEMLNTAVEEWFAARTGTSFADLHLGRRLGVPTVALESSFSAPSRLGDVLEIELIVERLGARSCNLRYRIACGDQDRVNASGVLVCMNLETGKAEPWPEDIRAGLLREEPLRISIAA